MRRRGVQRSEARGRGVAVHTRTGGQRFRIFPPWDPFSKKGVFSRCVFWWSSVFYTLCMHLWCKAEVLPYQTVIQPDALNNAAVEAAEDLMPNFLSLLRTPAVWCWVTRCGRHWCRRSGIKSCSPSPLQAPGCAVANEVCSSSSCPLSSPLSCPCWRWGCCLTPRHQTGHVLPVGHVVPPVMHPITAVSSTNFRMVSSLWKATQS